MKIDLAQYRTINKPAIKRILATTLKDHLTAVGDFCVGQGLPYIAGYHFLGELEGYTEDLENRIKELMKFYQVSEVLNQQREK